MGINEEFITWLRSEMASRGWNQTELAKAAHLPPNTVNSVLRGMRGAGPEFCNGIARALDLPYSLVYTRAALMPSDRTGKGSVLLTEICAKAAALPVDQQHVVLDVINGLRIHKKHQEGNGEPAP